MNLTTDTRTVLTAEDVAQQLQVPVTWVEEAARKKILGSRKIGRYRRFLQEDIDALLDANRVTGTNPLALSARSVANLRRQRRTA